MKYKLFGSSGLKVSEVCLGTMTFGEEWGTGADKTQSHKIFDQYANAGGNFFDTANRYTEGTSEKWLGEFMGAERDRYVLATKYSLYDDHQQDPNALGNSRKNLIRSVEGSLKRLQTDYIDLLWLHIWDYTTPVEEVMSSLHRLVDSGKVRYIGVSDTPAWVVAQANTLAMFRGWEAFIGLQIEYSLVERTPEGDLLPMAHHFGLGITPWSPLGAGLLTGKYLAKVEGQGRLSAKSQKMNQRNLKVARKVAEVAEAQGCSSAQVALAWLRQRSPMIIPIVGARKPEQLTDSLGCLEVNLSESEMDALSQVSEPALGFPHEFLGRPGVK